VPTEGTGFTYGTGLNPALRPSNTAARREEGWSSLPPYHPDYVPPSSPPQQRDPRLAVDFPEDDSDDGDEDGDDDDAPLTRVYSHFAQHRDRDGEEVVAPPESMPWAQKTTAASSSFGGSSTVRVRRGSEGYEVRRLSPTQKDAIVGWYEMSRRFKPAKDDDDSGDEGSEVEREEGSVVDSDEEDSLEGFVDDYE
jgi:hypothetical protein